MESSSGSRITRITVFITILFVIGVLSFIIMAEGPAVLFLFLNRVKQYINSYNLIWTYKNDGTYSGVHLYFEPSAMVFTGHTRYTQERVG